MGESISTIIIENEEAAYKQLQAAITAVGGIQNFGMAKTVRDGLALIKKTQPDIVLMDIELDDGLAFDILNQLDRTDFDVVFVTAFNSYYEKAMEHFAFNYLLKPIEPGALSKVIDRYRQVKARFLEDSRYEQFRAFIREQNSQILLQVGHEHISVQLDDILRCQADGNYTLVYFVDRDPMLVSHTLKHYHELLMERGFFRANRYDLINTRHIKSIYKKETVILKPGEKIHVSAKYKEDLAHLIKALT